MLAVSSLTSAEEYVAACATPGMAKAATASSEYRAVNPKAAEQAPSSFEVGRWVSATRPSSRAGGAISDVAVGPEWFEPEAAEWDTEIGQRKRIIVLGRQGRPRSDTARSAILKPTLKFSSTGSTADEHC